MRVISPAVRPLLLSRRPSSSLTMSSQRLNVVSFLGRSIKHISAACQHWLALTPSPCLVIDQERTLSRYWAITVATGKQWRHLRFRCPWRALSMSPLSAKEAYLQRKWGACCSPQKRDKNALSVEFHPLPLPQFPLAKLLRGSYRYSQFPLTNTVLTSICSHGKCIGIYIYLTTTDSIVYDSACMLKSGVLDDKTQIQPL